MRLRRLTAGDAPAIGDVFSATLMLGKPLPFSLDGEAWFRALALGWYIEHGWRDSVVALDDAGRVVGYGLVCTDPEGHRRWLRRRVWATTARLAAMTVSGEVAAPSRRFYGDRLRDAMHLARSGWHGAQLGHAHVNLMPGHRIGTFAKAVRDHVDERCRVAGLDGWIGEINARGEHRLAALERVAGAVVSTAPNYTLTRLVGQPVRRLTVRRLVSRGASGSDSRAVPRRASSGTPAATEHR